MTPSEKKAHNNGFILGMASKGIIKTSGEKEQTFGRPVGILSETVREEIFDPGELIVV